MLQANKKVANIILLLKKVYFGHTYLHKLLNNKKYSNKTEELSSIMYSQSEYVMLNKK